MKSRAYIETSIVSYLTARPSRDLIVAAQQQISDVWWNRRRDHYDLFVSELVIDESGRGDEKAAVEAEGYNLPILCTPNELMGENDDVE